MTRDGVKMDEKKMCDSCNGEFVECDGHTVSTAIGPAFFCWGCEEGIANEEEMWENDDPLTYYDAW